MPQKDTPRLTPQGYANLQQEYQYLVQKKRPQVLNDLREAREMGNLEDNLQYNQIREELALIEERIKELEYLLKHAQVAAQKKKDRVDIGSQVTVEIEGERETFTIVNPYESNPVQGKISYESPVGKALMGHRAGEKIEVTLPHTQLKYKIIKVN